ncbi:MAG: CDP-diacylglycerol--serine O-phosphatidyltransferase [Caldicoprobacterales bacterium]
MRLECDRLSKLHILPSAITYVNMSLGAIAIFISTNNTPVNIKIAALLVVIAGITDKLDGYVARKLRITSKFGRELDSLSDLVSFGMAPIVLWWNINNGLLGIREITVSLLFIGGGIFRLARYNISTDERYIIGLPITVAGMVMGGKHLLDTVYRLKLVSQSTINLENTFIIVLLSLLMISSFKVKKTYLKHL